MLSYFHTLVRQFATVETGLEVFSLKPQLSVRPAFESTTFEMSVLDVPHSYFNAPEALDVRIINTRLLHLNKSAASLLRELVKKTGRQSLKIKQARTISIRCQLIQKYH